MVKSEKKSPKSVAGKDGRGKDTKKKSKSLRAGLQFPVTRYPEILP